MGVDRLKLMDDSLTNHPTSIEICAGGGGQALGLEQAGFDHVALVEEDTHCCATLRMNRPDWNVVEKDVKAFDGKDFRGVDLLSGGVPCPPFSVAGKRLGADDERDLFPEILRLAAEVEPRAIMVENVRGIMDPRFDLYREEFSRRLESLGYEAVGWRLYNASNFGVPQLRPRAVFISLKDGAGPFEWAERDFHPDTDGHGLWREPRTVGETLHDLMAERGWPGAEAWRERADKIAPTIVGGSKKHGGPDLGPTSAKKAWAALGVDGLGIADAPPGSDFPKHSMPKLTVEMVKRLQGFPDEWRFSGRKTAAYRQVGNAFPPPVARAVGGKIREALAKGSRKVERVAR